MPSSTKVVRYRAQSFAQQSGRCYYCGAAMWNGSFIEFAGRYDLDENQVRFFQCSAEHLIARCEGGPDAPENIVAACIPCNGRRHRHKVPPTPEQYRKLIAREVGAGRWHRKWAFAKGVL